MTAQLDQFIRLDDWLTDSLPDYSEPQEPADWLTLCGRDGCPVMLVVNGRDTLLCYTSAATTDDRLHQIMESLRVAGFRDLAGWRGCPQSVVIDARHAGALILLDAPVANVWHVSDIEIHNAPEQL